MTRSARTSPFSECTEQRRLNDAREEGVPWKKWGPYLSERQWGTVREDYSADGNAWGYFTHDQARSRAYRWGEDGIAGISDDKQRLCFALALWNEKDPILKERLFGLTNGEGNHGEDVKEYYFYVDSTPTHSYMKSIYKYPQREFPYRDLVETNKRRSREEMEYELLDTGVFHEDRYFDVVLEYAKEGPEDLLIRVSVHNRGPEKARLHLLPTLWFRNTWSWGDGGDKPMLGEAGAARIRASGLAPNFRNRTGVSSVSSSVELTRPPKIVTATGCRISRPGSPAPNSSGVSARPAHSAVMSTGDSRSRLPRTTSAGPKRSPSNRARLM